MYGDHHGGLSRGEGGQNRGRGRSHRQGRSRYLQPALLVLLQHSPMHGYALMEKLAETLSISVMNPNQVYRTLRNLEALGAIESDWNEDESQGPPRRVYHLTDNGRELLGLQIKDLEETRDILDRLITDFKKAV